MGLLKTKLHDKKKYLTLNNSAKKNNKVCFCNFITNYIYFILIFQDDIQVAVKTLLSLKADYKNATGTEWKPGQPAASAQPAAPASGGNAAVDSPQAVELYSKVAAQGDLVRKMKTDKADKVSSNGCCQPTPSSCDMDVVCCQPTTTSCGMDVVCCQPTTSSCGMDVVCCQPTTTSCDL